MIARCLVWRSLVAHLWNVARRLGHGSLLLDQVVFSYGLEGRNRLICGQSSRSLTENNGNDTQMFCQDRLIHMPT